MRWQAFLLLAAALLGCASSPEVDPRYRPAESVLEVLAVLQRHVPDDTYRFPAAHDFTGRNVYRSSLLRLENLERLHADALRAGHMDGVIAFGKARALERLGAFDLAAESYRLAADRDAELADEALYGAGVCDELDRAGALTLGTGDTRSIADGIEIASPETVIARFEERAAALGALADRVEGSHYAPVVREAQERADVERAAWFVRARAFVPDGDLRAVAEMQRVVTQHGRSARAPRHMLALADLYARLSSEYAGKHPPESLHFDPAEFRDLVDSSARLYEMVAARDGTPEKIEATRKLEAFLAFALSVDRDRFTP
ncbi:MAG: hypothetical protein ACQGVC_17475 [Myxococcota bacterium]